VVEPQHHPAAMWTAIPPTSSPITSTSRVEPSPDLNAQTLDGPTDRHRAADGPARTVESARMPSPVVLISLPHTVDLFTRGAMVSINQVSPTTIA